MSPRPARRETLRLIGQTRDAENPFVGRCSSGGPVRPPRGEPAESLTDASSRSFVSATPESLGRMAGLSQEPARRKSPKRPDMKDKDTLAPRPPAGSTSSVSICRCVRRCAGSIFPWSISRRTSRSPPSWASSSSGPRRWRSMVAVSTRWCSTSAPARSTAGSRISPGPSWGSRRRARCSTNARARPFMAMRGWSSRRSRAQRGRRAQPPRWVRFVILHPKALPERGVQLVERKEHLHIVGERVGRGTARVSRSARRPERPLLPAGRSRSR